MRPAIQALIPTYKQGCATWFKGGDTNSELVRKIQLKAIFCFLRNCKLHTVGRGIRMITKSVKVLITAAAISNAPWLKQRWFGIVISQLDWTGLQEQVPLENRSISKRRDKTHLHEVTRLSAAEIWKQITKVMVIQTEREKDFLEIAADMRL
jgi:hypothetical protein